MPNVKKNKGSASWGLLHKPKDLLCMYACMCQAVVCVCVSGLVRSVSALAVPAQTDGVCPQPGSSETIKREISCILTG